MASGSRPNTVRVTLALTLLVIYGSLVAWVTLRPQPIDRGLSEHIESVIAILHRFGVPEWFGYSELEFSMNIVMFVPLGLSVALLCPAGKQWLALIILPLISIAIETTQYLFLAHRFATVHDVIANSLGGWIGCGVAVMLRGLVHVRDRQLRQ